MKLNILLFGGRGAKSSTPSKPSLGKVNGEEIRSFTLYEILGGEQEEMITTTSMQELYEQLEYNRKFNKRYQQTGYKYEVAVNTDTTSYEGYVLRKYKGKLRLK